MKTTSRVLIIIAVALGGVVFAGVGAGLWWVYDVNKRFEDAVVDLRAKGEPTTWEERAPPAVPDEENAALIYLKAFEKLYIPEDPRDALTKDMPCPFENNSGTIRYDAAEWDKWTAEKERRRAEMKLTPEQEHEEKLYKAYEAVWEDLDDAALIEQHLPEIREVLARNEETFELAEEAMKLPACRFPLDYSKGAETELAHLWEHLDLSRLWFLDGHVALYEGKIEEALEDAERIFRLSDALRTEPFIISQMIRYTMWFYGTGLLEKSLGRCETLPTDTARRILKRLETCKYQGDLVPAFKAERAQILGYIGRIRAGVDPSSPDLRKRFRGKANFVIKTWMAIDGLASIEWFHIAIRALEAHPWETQDLLQQESKYRKEIPELAILTRLFLPALDAAMEAATRADASVACAQAGVAVRLYRDKEGKWPDALEKLVPAYLNEVPIDLFTGKPLNYVLKENSAVVYSVGSNRTDDGGTPPGDDWEKNDITFEVRVPED